MSDLISAIRNYFPTLCVNSVQPTEASVHISLSGAKDDLIQADLLSESMIARLPRCGVRRFGGTKLPNDCMARYIQLFRTKRAYRLEALLVSGDAEKMPFFLRSYFKQFEEERAESLKDSEPPKTPKSPEDWRDYAIGVVESSKTVLLLPLQRFAEMTGNKCRLDPRVSREYEDRVRVATETLAILVEQMAVQSTSRPRLQLVVNNS